MTLPTTTYIAAPKMASTAVCAHLGVTHQHIRASSISGPCWGTIRSPLAWYRSWYGHVAQWDNPRCVRALEGLGRGDASFPSVLWGLTHLSEIDRECLPVSDHLFAPGGLGGHEGLWTAMVHHFFRSDRGWAIDELVHVRDLPPMPRLNGGARVPPVPPNAAEIMGAADALCMIEIGRTFGVRW